ncbi:MAG: AAA family ATPase [Ardenticatenaceae bacterium]|nr:AAA family ATPase [Ardenticatenaceae bacterium]
MMSVTDRQELVQAISALETQRHLLGNEVVDTAIIALRDQLAVLQAPLVTELHKPILVLVADLSGFTAMSETMDVEEVGETMNRLWQRLDGVVEAWGGTVDKHAGDSLIALFGLPQERHDDAERAVQAALAMQVEMDLFNRGVSVPAERAELRWGRPRPQLRMRIGIHAGPVYFGQVGNTQKYTAVGDTLNVATQLEEQAPLGKVLVSEQVYRQVHGLFEAELLEGGEARSEALPAPRAYIIQGNKPRGFREPDNAIRALDTRLVGRTSELGQLEYALQTAIDSATAQVVTIVGERGVGKSRLLREFEQRLQLLPVRVRLFRGQGQPEMGQSAYSLVRDLFTSHFAIHPRHSAEVAREKFVQGVLSVLAEAHAEVKPDPMGYRTTPLEQAYLLGQLIGFDFQDSLYSQGINYDSQRIREHAFDDVARFFRGVTEQAPAAVLILEDLHWADEGSFELLEYLVKTCWDIPLLVVCLARPQLYEKRPSWQTLDSLDPMTYVHLPLPPLSAIDSRHLVTELLAKVPKVPLRLVDLVVSWANGNPYQIEAFLLLLLEKQIIATKGEEWQVKMGKLAEMRIPSTLGDLHRERLESLPAQEAQVLRRAAVVGRHFWDLAVMQLGEAQRLVTDEVEEALGQLVARGFIYPSQTAAFAGTREYVFAHDTLHEAVYESLKFTKRQQYHAQAAMWLVAYRGTDTGYYHQDPPEYASVIAMHFERAGELTKAVDWYGRAGRRAKERNIPETAVFFYRQALNLLAGDDKLVAQQLTLNAGLGGMLRQLARFDEAVVVFQQMQQLAARSQQPDVETMAWVELVLTQLFQGRAEAALQSGQRAQAAAQAATAPYQGLALVATAWAMLELNDPPTALKLCQEGLVLTQAGETEPHHFGTAVANTVMGRICWQLGRLEQAVAFIKEALDAFSALGEQLWIGILLRQLGDVAEKQGELGRAQKQYEDGLRTSRDSSDFYGAMLCWQKLAQLAQQRKAYETAEGYQQQALLFAEKSGNRERLADVARDLGELYIARADDATSLIHRDHYLDQSRIWFDKALDWAEQTDSATLRSRVEAGFTRLLVAETAV